MMLDFSFLGEAVAIIALAVNDCDDMMPTLNDDAAFAPVLAFVPFHHAHVRETMMACSLHHRLLVPRRVSREYCCPMPSHANPYYRSLDYMKHICY